MKVRFFNTDKRVNSTFIPTDFEEYDCQLKDDCSITAPQITLSRLVNYNYCYIPKFGRYYFVTSCIIETGTIYTYTLAVDVLASYKDAILDQTTYVKRSASNWNPYLIDDTWVHESIINESVKSVSNGSISSTGCYVITVVNRSTQRSANPASTMYVLADYSLSSFLSNMFDMSRYDDITELEATYFNPYQYVTSCRWLPLAQSVVGGSGQGEPITYGWFDHAGVSAQPVANYGTTLLWSIDVPDNDDWTGKSPEWTKHLLYIPFCGEIEIDPMYSGQTINITQYIDFNTGSCNTVVTDGLHKIISAVNGVAGAEVAISQVAGNPQLPTNKGELVVAGVKALGGSIAADKQSIITFGKSLINKIGKSFGMAYGQTSYEDYKSSTIDGGSNVVKAVSDGLTNALLNPTVSVSGADGARYSIMERNQVHLVTRWYERSVDAHTFTGGLLHQIVKLSTLSGYTQVANGMFKINALDEEKSAIRQLVETGFYIE